MVVKIIGFSFNEPKFNSQHPHDVSQLPLTPVLGISDALFWLLQAMHALGAQIHMQITFPHTKQNRKHRH